MCKTFLNKNLQKIITNSLLYFAAILFRFLNLFAFCKCLNLLIYKRYLLLKSLLETCRTNKYCCATCAPFVNVRYKWMKKIETKTWKILLNSAQEKSTLKRKSDWLTNIHVITTAYIFSFTYCTTIDVFYCVSHKSVF